MTANSNLGRLEKIEGIAGSILNVLGMWRISSESMGQIHRFPSTATLVRLGAFLCKGSSEASWPWL